MNWPFGRSYSLICSENENGSSGFYPFGAGTLWHSGIHIKANKDFISPIVNGTLVAYRLSDKEPGGLFPVNVTKSYLDFVLSGYNEWYTQNNSDKKLYTLKDNRARIGASNYFVLLKHEIPQISYTFYSLYTNLAEVSKELQKDFGNKIKFDGNYHDCSKDNISISKIPVGNKYLQERYFDFILFSEQNIFNTQKIKDDKEIIRVKKEVGKYYKLKEKISETPLDTYLITNGSSYKKIDEESNGNEACSKIELKSFNAMYRIEKDGVYWVSPSDYDTAHIDYRKNRKTLVNESLHYLKELFDEGKFTEKYKNKTSCPTVDKKSEIPFSDLEKINNPIFWLSADDSKDFTAKIGEDGKCGCSPESFKEYKVYTNYPFKYSFEECINSSTDDIGDFDICEPVAYTGNIVDNSVCEKFYKIEGTDYFVKESDVERVNAFDWKEWFNDLTEKVGKSDNILCDKNEFIRKLDCKNELNTLFNNVKKYSPSDFYRILGGYGEDDSTIAYVLKIRRELRKAVCKHSLEFDKSLFPDKNDKKQCTDFSKKYSSVSQNKSALSPTSVACLSQEAENLDLWNNGLSNMFMKGNNFYFMHPAYLLRHFERSGLFEFNPYEGMTYRATYKDTSKLNEVYNRDKSGGDKAKNMCSLPDSWKVESNPGFTTKPSVAEKKFSKGTAKGYGKVTGLFNEDYLNVKDGNDEPYYKTRNWYYHFGIDFSGAKDDPIISLIYGKVIAKCWISTNGRCLLIQGKTTNNLYMLCHLSAYADNLKEGDDVFPGKEVAKVGCSGIKNDKCNENAFKGKEHLHLSVIQWNKPNVSAKEVLKKEKKVDIVGGEKEEHREWLNVPIYLDPFDYKYEGGWLQKKS